MVEGMSAMLPVSSVHVVPLVAADIIPLPLRSRDIPKKYDCRGPASTTPKYGDILHGLTVQSTQQDHDTGGGSPLPVKNDLSRGNSTESNAMHSSYSEPTTAPVVRDDQDIIRNHEQIEKAGQTSSLSTPPIFQPVQGRFFYHGYAEEAIFNRGAIAKKVESSLDKFTRIPFSESTENVTNHRKGAYTPISLEVWQTLTWRPHINNAVQTGSCLGFEIVSDIIETRHLKKCGKSRRKTVNIMNVETEAELMQRKFLL